MGALNHRQLATIIHDFNRLDVNPGSYFVHCWTRRAIQPQIMWEDEDIKRIRYADMKLGLNLLPDVLTKPKTPGPLAAAPKWPANAAN